MIVLAFLTTDYEAFLRVVVTITTHFGADTVWINKSG